MTDPRESLPLSYETPSKPTGSPALRWTGNVLMLVGASGLICTVVGLTRAFAALNTSPTITPAQFAISVSRALCFTTFGLVLSLIGFALRLIGSRIRGGAQR